MNKEEIFKKVCEEMGYSPSDFAVSRLEDIKADLYQLNYSQRGLGGIIIGDDGRHVVCGSLYPLTKYIEDFKKQTDDIEFNNKMTEKLEELTVLRRSELLNMFLEFEKTISRDNLKLLDVRVFLDELESRLKLSKPNPDPRFEPYGRMLFLQKELDKYLNEKNYFDAIYDIKDYLCDSRNTAAIPHELFDKNKEYFEEDIICSEEKEILMNMIKKYLNEIGDKI